MSRFFLGFIFFLEFGFSILLLLLHRERTAQNYLKIILCRESQRRPKYRFKLP